VLDRKQWRSTKQPRLEAGYNTGRGGGGELQGAMPLMKSYVTPS